jgi:predicted GNAT family N-acyltransferase
MVFECGIFRGEQLLVTVDLLYVFADPATQTSKPVPQALRDCIEGYERGEEMVTVRTGRWDELGADAREIRLRVFVGEQKIPVEEEWDDADAVCVHAVAYNRLGMAVGTGRLLPAEGSVSKIGRMAVHEVLRGSGVGRQILRHLMAAAETRGDKKIVLHAQVSAVGFYQRDGFSQTGEPFQEAGIAHVAMRRALE